MEIGTFFSQAGQDSFVAGLFKNYSPESLFFIDLAAYDGVHLNNTLALEKAGWNGVCVEANRSIFSALVNNRTSRCENVVVLDYDGFCGFEEKGLIGSVKEGSDFKCVTFESLLNGQKVVDYLSLDVEGAEYKILSKIDFESVTIKVITVEHNLYTLGPQMKNQIFDLLSKNGFYRVREDVVVDGTLPFEDWYIHESFRSDV